MSRRGWKLGSAALVVAVLCGVVTAGFASAKPAGKLTAAAGTLNIYGFGPGDDVQENRAAYAKSRLANTDINRPAADGLLPPEVGQGPVPRRRDEGDDVQGRDLRPAGVLGPGHADRQPERVQGLGRADQRGADDELEAAPRDREEADKAERERRPHPDRVRPQAPRVLPALGQVVRQGHHLE